jgi:sugar/nucleoside kinase (ribokinase family)
MGAKTDCVVCGSCVVDILCRPVSLDQPIGHGVLHEIEPLQVTGGGIVSNTGIAMARMGMNVAAFSHLGQDAWAKLVRDLYQGEGLDTALLIDHDSEATSTTVVTIDPTGERSFFHCVGAPRTMTGRLYDEHFDALRQARMVLVGYYSLMPNLEDDLPAVFAKLRKAGCQTALDAAGTGGGMSPLDRILPELDVYVPSLAEATHQTGEDDPRKIIAAYRGCGAPGLLGVKLGQAGVLLSERAGQFLEVPICSPPGDVVDTTGAGDTFYAGLLTGLLKGMSVEEAGRLGAAAGACAVTTVGGCTGGRDYATTAKIAGLAR